MRWRVIPLACLVAWAATAPAATNILLLIADDYGADSCGLYNSTNSGASLPPTPNIDALAGAGVLFRNACANPVCSPTRACIITGRHAFRTGIGDVIQGPTSPRLELADVTLPDVFAANPARQYAPAQFGKWHLGDNRFSPNTIGGWPHFAGSVSGAVPSYTNWTKVVNGTQTAGFTNYATCDVTDDAIAWIQAQNSTSWFAWVAYNAPHAPLHKPPTNLCPHYAALSGTAGDISTNPRRYYEAMVESLDTEIGRLLAAVNRTNTTIIFLGDNGTPGNVIQPPYDAPGRAKDTLYEGGIRVPLVVAGPAVVAPGRTNDTPVHAVDLFATILDLAGIDLAATTNVHVDAQSLMPLLLGTSGPMRRAYSEIFGGASGTADGQTLRNDRYKLLRFVGGAEALYDLRDDPAEATNLLAAALGDEVRANYYGLKRRLGACQDDVSPAVTTAFSPTGGACAVTAVLNTNRVYTLWRAAVLDELAWSPVTNAAVVTNGATLTLTDPGPPGGTACYQLTAVPP